MRILKTNVMLLVFIICLSGCSGSQAETVLGKIADILPRQSSNVEKSAAAFFEAVDNRNTDAAKALFAPSALVDEENFDAAMEQLFILYTSPTDECWSDSTPSASKHLTYGKTTYHSVSGWIPVVSAGVNYYCYIVVTDIDDETPENIGINKLVFATEKARCAADFERPQENGLWIFDDPPDADYQTCRIGENAYIYTPSEQELTKEDAVSFLEKNASWTDFTARFGAPNVTAYPDRKDWNIYYYELPDEDGEARWIRLSAEDGTVTSAILMGRSYHANGVLWKKED